METLAERLQTVERAVSDGETDLPNAATLGKVESRVEALEERLEEIDDRTVELEAATQALRGYVGNVRSVNEDVEQRADAALAATDRLERELAIERGQCDDADPRGQKSDTSRQLTPETTTDRFGGRASLNGSGPETRRRSETPASSITRNAGSPQEARQLETAIGDGDPTERFDSTRHESSENTEEAGFLARIRELL